jgi:hypothetical protein
VYEGGVQFAAFSTILEDEGALYFSPPKFWEKIKLGKINSTINRKIRILYEDMIYFGFFKMLGTFIR